ncbi:MAG: glycosyltransferase family 2 protein [Candidatus Sungiibacteriota bacterium]
MRPKLSIVIPLHNEAASIMELHARLLDTLSSLSMGQSEQPFEIIYIDDGSTDETSSALSTCIPARIMRLKRNYGQTIALGVGVRSARGDIIITMDGDLENHPEDIPLLLAKLAEGHDVVSGWRHDRWLSHRITRRLPSRLANALISRLCGIPIHDMGCTLKAYRASVFDRITFSGDMHRLLLAYLARHGVKIAEIPVRFSPRRHGTSHYGIGRIFDTMIDILAFTFFEHYHNRPMQFFGKAAFLSFAASLAAFLWMLWLKFFSGASFIQTPLPILTVSFTVIGVQFLLLGLIAELIYRLSLRKQAPSPADYIKEDASFSA